MSNSNKSQAANHKLEFQSGNQSAWLNFMSNINSREYTTDSNNLQIDFVSLNDIDNTIVLGIKTPRTVAIVLLYTLPELKAQLKHQMEIEDQWIQKNQISCFKFDKNSSSSDINDLKVILGFNTGAIRIYKVKNNQLLMSFNVIEKSEQQQSDLIWLKKKVIKISLPSNENSKNKQTILALFEDGHIMEFSLNNQNQSQKILNDVQNMVNSFGFQQIKGIKGVQKQDNQFFRFQSLSDNEFTHISVQFKSKDTNPIALYKFECTSVNEIEILPFSPLDYVKDLKLNQLSERYLVGTFRDDLLIAYTGLDGYFRIMEVKQMVPQFSFRSEYGGFSSFAFNPSYSMVCLAAQDDSTYVVSFQLKITWLKLVGHCSFISRAVFSQINENIIRVISGSYDGYISFTELNNQDIFTRMREKTYKSNQYIVGLSDDQTMILDVENKLLMNTDGICNTVLYSNFLATVNFDGCITIFHFQDYKNQLEESLSQKMIQE